MSMTIQFKIAFVLAAFFSCSHAWGQAAGEWKSGEEVWDKTCHYCHDAAHVGPDLRGRGLPAPAIAFIVRNGVGAMPSFPESQLNDAELKTLSEWVSKLQPSDKVKGPTSLIEVKKP